MTILCLHELLPACVAVSTRRTNASPDTLHDTERPFVASAVESRRREFAAVRACARDAMQTLGRAPASISCGPRGEPGWPPGIVGSMTHCQGMYAAAVATSRDVHTLGIDAEVRAPLPSGVLSQVSSSAEEAHLAELTHDIPDVPWDRLLFSAKEAVYKLWYPVTRTLLGFDDATISFSPHQHSFRVNFTAPELDLGFAGDRPLLGRFAATEHHVLTALCLLTD